MSDLTRYQGQAKSEKIKVFFTGSTALRQGVGVAYDRDRGTAASADGTRDNYVEALSTSNHRAFAGVTAAAYRAVTGGQWIDIYTPGSICEVEAWVATTVNATMLGANIQAGGGFATGGLNGAGGALALQTSALVSSASANGLVASSLDGTATWTASSNTLTKSSAFTYAAAGDVVKVFAGMTTSGQLPVTVFETTIASVTSANAVVLAAAPFATDGDATGMHFAVIRGTNLVLALLLEGPDSGVTEFIQPIGATTTQTAMAGGTTFIAGGTTVATSNSRGAIPLGGITGTRKYLRCTGTLTTNDYQVDTDVAAIYSAAGSALVGDANDTGIAFDAANEEALLVWTGVAWMLLGFAGCTIDTSAS